MDLEQVQRESHAMRAEAAAMIGESSELIAGCRAIRTRMVLPGKHESELRIKLAAFRTTLAAVVNPIDRLFIECQIATTERELYPSSRSLRIP